MRIKLTNRSGEKHGVRWEGWVADPKRVYAHRGRQGILVHLVCVELVKNLTS